MTSPIGGTHFRRNEYGKVVGLDWTKHVGDVGITPPEAKPAKEKAVRKRRTDTHCMRGHDLSLPKAREANGQCAECRRERVRARKGCVAYDPNRCRNGHDLTLPNAKNARGRCRECQRLASLRAWRKKQEAAK